MRIIAGEMRSRKLKAPEGMDTRPTADRVKEALFSILGSRIYGARVLDLYGGSGALALEAVSRGADSAVICDLSAKACAVIQENIDTLNCGDKVKLLRMKDTAALADVFIHKGVDIHRRHTGLDDLPGRCQHVVEQVPRAAHLGQLNGIFNTDHAIPSVSRTLA